MASYDGVPLFGRSVSIRMEQNPSAKQLVSFFGLNGVYSLGGGGRGRTFFIQGVLAASSDAELSSLMGLILSYDDNIARVLVDTVGNTWPEVVFDRFQPGERYMHANTAALIDYRMTMIGLI
jgi:hypothetical protein